MLFQALGDLTLNLNKHNVSLEGFFDQVEIFDEKN